MTLQISPQAQTELDAEFDEDTILLLRFILKFIKHILLNIFDGA